jgi:hypothetical protein
MYSHGRSLWSGRQQSVWNGWHMSESQNGGIGWSECARMRIHHDSDFSIWIMGLPPD